MVATGYCLSSLASCGGYLSFNKSLSHLSLSGCIHFAIHEYSLSAGDLFNPVAVPFTAHVDTHTQTHSD